MKRVLCDVMTKAPVTLDVSDTVLDAARCMRRAEVGAVLVQENGTPCGIVTDRDLVVRGLANGGDPATLPLRELCSFALATLEPGATVEDALNLMCARGIRRVAVVEGSVLQGIVSLGDLARVSEPESALGRVCSRS